MTTILIFDRAQEIQTILASTVLKLLPNCNVQTTGDLQTAKHLVAHLQPRLVITEAIPVLDCLHPEAIDQYDPGKSLITHIRHELDTPTHRTWIIVNMSRMPEDIPDEFRELLDEHALIFQKPSIIKPLRENLPILEAILRPHDF